MNVERSIKLQMLGVSFSKHQCRVETAVDSTSRLQSKNKNKLFLVLYHL